MLCLLGAHTRFLSVYVISDVNILAGPCGLVFNQQTCLKALLQVFNILSSAVEARLQSLAQGS
jgi:hypothetical protein